MSSSNANPPPGSIPFVNADHIVRTINPDGDEIRKFADSNIQQSMDRVLAGLEPGKSIAVVVTPEFTSAHGGRVTGAVMFRKPGSDWSFVTAVHKNLGGEKDFGVQASIRWSR